jgi:hypothetical protein|tara:strand:- start:415 stop:516 length:102 start_codon:yes stop_codon:yes gene_type:complete
MRSILIETPAFQKVVIVFVLGLIFTMLPDKKSE